jgi:cytosine/adenosine deaminase-related metal-dependent hydrolase
MCLEAGTTAVGDIISNPALALLYRKLPLAGRHYFELLGQDEVLFESKRAAALEAIESIQSGLMKPGLSPHAPYTIGEKNLLTIRNDSHTLGLPLAIHLSESADETDLIFDSSGPLAEKFYPFVGWGRYLTPPRSCSSTELLDRFSLLNQHTLAVHCVHLTAGDARILKERDVSIVLCPRSNDRLDVGRAPVPIFNKLGIRLAIGTDSLASNDSISLWDELRYALDAFPHELTPFDLLKMATIGGATALGQAEEFGTLEVGKRADFQVVENIGNGAGDLIERVMLEGIVREVYTAGKRFTGFAEKNVHNAVEKRGRYGTED